MRRAWHFVGLLAAGIALVAGCEWESSDDVYEARYDAIDWVNFDGVYRPPDGATFLVSTHEDPDSTATDPTLPSPTCDSTPTSKHSVAAIPVKP